MERPPSSDHPRSVPGLVGTAVALMLLVGAVVASGVDGSWDMEPRFALPDLSSPDITLPTLSGDFELGENVDVPPMIDLPWVGFLGRVVVTVAVVAALWWLWTRLRELIPAFRTRTGLPAGDGVGDDLPDLPTLEEGVATAHRHLDTTGDAGNAVIAAWLALEEAAEASGVGRRPAQTPTEFTRSVLGATAADRAAVTALLGLYQQARFSDHPITATDVEDARRHLTAISASWVVATAEATDR